MAGAGAGGAGPIGPDDGELSGHGTGDDGSGNGLPAGLATTGRRERPGRRSRRGRMHFWVVQLAELVVALGLVDMSIHVTRAAVLLGAAGILAVMSLTAKGPLGVIRVVGRPTHRVLALVVAAGMALAPLLPILRPGAEGIAILELGAIALARVATLVRVSPVVPLPEQLEPERTGRRADQDGAGTAPGPELRAGPPPVERLARWAGRATAQAGTTAARVADTRGPAARVRLLRAVRTTGRMTGRVTAAKRRPQPTRDPER